MAASGGDGRRGDGAVPGGGTLDRLAAGAAHDFKNLLLAMTCSAERLARPDLTEAERRLALAEVHRAADRAALLTGQLLDPTTLATPDVRLVRTADLVEASVELVAPLMAGEVEVTADVACDVMIAADQGQIERSVMNLLLNAREAMAGHGKVDVRVRAREVAAGEVSGLFGGTYAVVEVSDTGSGMSPAVCARAFEPCFTTRGGRGRGLGLANVQRIVAAHGGAVQLDSQPGLGTTVRMWLPACPLARRVDGAGARVLVAEDEPAVRDVVCTVLRDAGFDVVPVTNGRQAVEEVERRGGELDAVLLDVVMPEMDGIEAFRSIAETRPGLKVLFTSAHDASAVLELGLDPSALLSKPYVPAALVQRLRDVLGR